MGNSVSSSDNLTPEERARLEKQEVYRQAEEAATRRIAERDAAGYSSPQSAPMASSANAPPPPAPVEAPAPAGPNGAPAEGLIRGMADALTPGKPAAPPPAQAQEGGPAEEFLRGAVDLVRGGETAKDLRSTVSRAAAATQAEQKAGPRSMDAPLDLAGPGGGRVVPAGFAPEKMETQAKLGKPVPESAKRGYEAASGFELGAAGAERDSAKQYYERARDAAQAQMQANSDAIAAHQRVQADRDAIVGQKIAQIQKLNQEAQGKPEDLWNDRTALAGFLGTIMSSIGIIGGIGLKSPGLAAAGTMGGKMIDGFIQQDINSKLAGRKAAGERAGRETDLLSLHEKQLGDQDKAIEATRLAYYDNVLQQMESFRAEHAAQVSDVNYERLLSDILKRKADTENHIAIQEANDVQQAFSQRWHAAQVVGGGAQPGIREGEHVVTLPASDKTGEHETHVAVPAQAYADLQKTIGATGALVMLDREALIKRKELRRAISDSAMGNIDKAQRVATIRTQLMELQRKRIQTEQKADGEGVTREADFKHAIDMGVDYTAGIAGHDVAIEGDKNIQHSMNTLTGLASARVRGASGWVVKPSVVQGKGGQRQPGWSYTGELFRGQPVPPEGDDKATGK